MVLNSIGLSGCPRACDDMPPEHSFDGAASIIPFEGRLPILCPPIGQEKSTTQLFLPSTSDCRYIDGILVHWSSDDATVTISPIRITIAQKHSPSDVLFMENSWKTLAQGAEGWTIIPRFLWIKETMQNSVRLDRRDRKEAVATRTRGPEEVHPAYDVVTITVEEVNSEVGKQLQAARSVAGNIS